MNKQQVLAEIKAFLDGYNSEIKYLVNVETNPSSNIAECVIHEPGQPPRIEKIAYESFMYAKQSMIDKLVVYKNDIGYDSAMRINCGVTITKLKTGNQKRLINGYCYKLTSHKSYNHIVSYLREGGVDPFEKLYDDEGKLVRDKKGDIIYPNRDGFFAPRTNEQFLISKKARLFKGYNEYKDVHKVTFDIETSGLRYQIHRVFAIGVRDNRGYETILEVEKINDDESEIQLIKDFFNVVIDLQPAVISGYYSEGFDFDFILGRAKMLKMDLTEIKTSLKSDHHIYRRPNVSVKYGNSADKYTATEMWGISVIDILHAAKRTAAVNTELKETGLKYVAKFEKIAKPNRTYIKGEDSGIYKFYSENKVFVADEKNNYIIIPDEFQETARKLYTLQANKSSVSDAQYKELKAKYLSSSSDFVEWLRKEAVPKGMTVFISGKKLLRQYLLDDLWETEHVDELYNQSSFMLAKIVPTTYQRICTMGTASIWNLLLTAWSYENDLAIPHPDVKTKFSGGLARTFKKGYTKRYVKIDAASLYPMIQLSEDVFPIFDITNVIKKILLYLTTTRNIYKKLASGDELKEEEILLMKEIDHETYEKYVNGNITDADKAMFKIKQLPIKILNNSLFGALGSDISFNWSDNICAARITCVGRIHLRHAMWWFSQYGCIPLLAVTDGINFNVPDMTKIRITDDGVFFEEVEGKNEDMWNFGGKTGIAALIAKFNKEEMKPPYMSFDNDGEFEACLNLARINYASLSYAKDKKTGEIKEKIKLTGNTIKSKAMPEYIEEFLDKGLKLILLGKGIEFVNYYKDYVSDLYYQRIPLKKIASKSKLKQTLTAYKKRGKDKNGREKGMQAHMELLIEKRNKIAEKLFEEHKHEFELPKKEEKLKIEDKMKLVANYMPPEPELDSVIYYVNTGTLKSHGSSSKIVDKITGEERFCSTLISNEDIIDNPNMLGKYNVVKYLDAFNKRIKTILVGFDPQVAAKIPAKIVKTKVKDEFGNKKVVEEIKFEEFTSDMLKLKNYDLDDLDESMYLEKKEVEFWNSFGYDPRLIWNGFKMYDDDKVYFEIYESALKYLNDIMASKNKPNIKSINDKLEKNDLVLLKYDNLYSIGAYNGTYIQIIKDVDIPKSEIELELERKKEEEERKLKELESILAQKTEEERKIEMVRIKREKYYDRFKKRFKIPMELSMEALTLKVENAMDMLDEYIMNSEAEDEEENAEYADVDEIDGAE